MDASRSSSRSRRSYPNLHNLSLAPLSSKYPIDPAAPDSPTDGRPHTPHSSYIVPKSAPSTPGILSLGHSRSSSRNDRQRSKGFAYDGYLRDGGGGPVRDVGDIPKAISTDAMITGVSFADQPRKRHHERKKTAPLPVRVPLLRRHTSETHEEWFHRAGLAIAGETRDSKGQGWLVRRESSTSLVQQTDEYERHPSHDGRHMALLSGEHLPGLEHDYFTPYMSRAGSRINSRVASRVPSARTSRRGSRVGSRVDLYMTPGAKTPARRSSIDEGEGAFSEHVMEPDFVEADEESGDDEEEVARLARERGFGLGTWMDKLIGWTLFSVEEDGEDSDDDTAAGSETTDQLTMDELRLRREVEARRRKLERETIMAAATVKTDDKPEMATQSVDVDEGGGWSDAAWLLSVASKVIL